MIRQTIPATLFVGGTKPNTVPGLSKTVSIGPTELFSIHEPNFTFEQGFGAPIFFWIQGKYEIRNTKKNSGPAALYRIFKMLFGFKEFFSAGVDSTSSCSSSSVSVSHSVPSAIQLSSSNDKKNGYCGYSYLKDPLRIMKRI